MYGRNSSPCLSAQSSRLHPADLAGVAAHVLVDSQVDQHPAHVGLELPHGVGAHQVAGLLPEHPGEEELPRLEHPVLDHRCGRHLAEGEVPRLLLLDRADDRLRDGVQVLQRRVDVGAGADSTDSTASTPLRSEQR